MKTKAHAAPTDHPASLIVTAEVHDDLEVSRADFNATPWFEQASDDQILALAKINWGGNYASDRVAEFFIGKDAEVSRVFETTEILIQDGNTLGFECYVDEASALAWLEAHRSALWAQITSDQAVAA